MGIGAFSLSLSVKDLSKSKDFYEKIGFKVFGGSKEENYLIMKNDDCLIGLFQGMFEGNILTFNPGWDSNAENTEEFTSVSELKKLWKDKGIELMSDDTSEEGRGSFMVADPDGNIILVDQHRD